MIKIESIIQYLSVAREINEDIWPEWESGFVTGLFAAGLISEEDREDIFSCIQQDIDDEDMRADRRCKWGALALGTRPLARFIARMKGIELVVDNTKNQPNT